MNKHLEQTNALTKKHEKSKNMQIWFTGKWFPESTQTSGHVVRFQNKKKLQLTLQPYTLEMFSLLHKGVEGKQVSFWEKSTKSKQDGNQCPLANKAGGYTIYYHQSSKFLM